MNAVFADALCRLRLERNLSQEQLARKLFIDRSSIANWEHGRRLPDAVLITRLAGVLGVDISVLFDAAAVEAGPPNVILVDDEAILVAGTLPVLAEAMPRASVTGFTRVSEATRYARENRVAVAFLDIELGQQSGLDLCRALIDIYPLTNVIYLTSYPDYSLKAWGTSASGFLVKPLKVGDVKEALGKLRHPVRGFA